MKNKIWKYDASGKERPLKEQLLRRQGDLKIIEDKIEFYRKHTFHSNALKKRASEIANQKHYTKVFRDIQSIEKELEK